MLMIIDVFTSQQCFVMTIYRNMTATFDILQYPDLMVLTLFPQVSR